VRRSRDAAVAHPQHRPVCRGEIHLPGDGLHGGGFGACRHGQAVQLGDLKLEVGRINRFLERKTMSCVTEKPGIIVLPLRARLPTAQMGTTSNNITGIVILGRFPPKPTFRSTVRSTPSFPCMVLSLRTLFPLKAITHRTSIWFALVTGSCPKSISRCLLVKIPNCGEPVVWIILTCTGSSHRCGPKSPLCTLKVRLHVGFNR
jgi:hypothetical protein